MIDPADPLTAPEDSIRRRRPDAELTLRDVATDWISRNPPRLILLALTAAVALRATARAPDWHDAVVVGGLIAVFPLAEWAIHVYLLHSRPVRWRGRRWYLPTTREHHEHHRAPAVLDGVLVPVYGLVIFFALIALTIWGLSFPINAVLGGDRIAGSASALVCAYAILAVYEWTHFLIHTPYRPRGRRYRAIWRNHRLHHYKNERFWFGVTTTVGDRILGTDPDQREVPRSRTARSLGET